MLVYTVKNSCLNWIHIPTHVFLIHKLNDHFDIIKLVTCQIYQKTCTKIIKKIDFY